MKPFNITWRHANRRVFTMLAKSAECCRSRNKLFQRFRDYRTATICRELPMSYSSLDNTELLHLALDAMKLGRDADATALLKTLVEREPGHAYAQYLLGAQYAQIGMLDQAEACFRIASDLAPEFPFARFQLGQLLLVQDRAAEAHGVLAGLSDPVLHAYADGLLAAAEGRTTEAVEALRAGLQLPQENAPLADDMHRLMARLSGLETIPSVNANDGVPAGAGMLLSNYGRLS